MSTSTQSKTEATKARAANKTLIRDLQSQYTSSLEQAMIDMLELAYEQGKRSQTKKPLQTPLLDASGNTVERSTLTHLIKLMRRTLQNLPDTYAQITKDNKTRTSKGANLNVVSDAVYNYLQEGLASMGIELKELMEEIAPGASQFNIIETSALSNRIMMMLAQADQVLIPSTDEKKPDTYKSITGDAFTNAFGADGSAALVVDGEDVDSDRGLSNHSQADINALETYKDVERTTIMDVLLASANDGGKSPFTTYTVDGVEYRTFNPVTLSRTITAMGTVPNSFLTDEERAVIDKAKKLPKTNQMTQQVSERLKLKQAELQAAR